MARFKTDLASLRRRIDLRAASIKRAREPHEPVWKVIRDNIEPQFARPLDGIDTDTSNQQAPLADSEIINSHPRQALSRMGAGMQGGITSPSSQWFRLAIEDPDLAERPDVKDWLDDVTSAIAYAFSRSNIYTVTHQLYLHCGAFGTAASLVVPDDSAIIHGILLDEGSYWIACDRSDRATHLLRAFRFTASQIRQAFGIEAVEEDQTVRDAIANDRPEDQYTVWHFVMPNDGSVADIPPERPFLSIYWRQGATSTFLDIRSFSYNPIIAPRWHILAGPYGFGPGHVAVSDCKELQKLESDLLEATAAVVRPPLTAPNSMSAAEINNYPGGITYRNEEGLADDRRPTLAPLYEIRPDINALRELRRDVADRISATFFTDLFAMMLNLSNRPKQMTAREVNELSQEKMALLGPVLTRMNTDMLDPLIDASYAILQEAGRLPPPPESIQGRPLTVRYVSILHTEQQSTSRLGAMIRLMDFAALVAPASPNCADKIDADQAIDEAAKVLDVPSRVIRPDEAVARIRRSRQQASQSAALAEQMKSVAGVAGGIRDLSETRTGTGSALDNIMKNITGKPQ